MGNLAIYLAIGMWVAFTTRLIVGADERYNWAIYLFLIVAWPLMVVSFVILGVVYSVYECAKKVLLRFRK